MDYVSTHQSAAAVTTSAPSIATEQSSVATAAVPSSSSRYTTHDHDLMQRRNRQETYRLQYQVSARIQAEAAPIVPIIVDSADALALSSLAPSQYCPTVAIQMPPRDKPLTVRSRKQSCRCTVHSLKRNGMNDNDFCLACLDSGVSCLVKDHINPHTTVSDDLQYTIFAIKDQVSAKFDSFINASIPYAMRMDRLDDEEMNRRRQQEYEDFCLRVYNMV